jgi:enterobacterial common antigen flippase
LRSPLPVESTTMQADASASAVMQRSSASRRTSYGDILRSSALIGGSSILVVVVSLVRNKALALMLGPAGIGLLGAFNTIVDLARSLSALGISNSGVRRIAESAASGDLLRVSRTATVIRRTTVILGAIGAALLALFSRQVSELTFGDPSHATAVALLSIALLLRLVADGQGALMQGLRRIGQMSKANVAGAALGTLVAVALVYWLRADGIAWSVVALAAGTLLVSWWYSRKVELPPAGLNATQARAEVSAILRLGLAFMVSGLLMMGAAYAVRLILIREIGLEAAGLYQAAWAIGGMYVGFVLQAMGTDFYPRLVGLAQDDAGSTRLVNEQAHVSLLLAGTGVMATLAFAPFVLFLLYSASFEAAAPTLRWICLGMTLRVITWPMGFIIVARNAQAIFIATETAWTLVSVGLAWLFVGWWGVEGAGIAFFASYVFHGLMIYPIVCRMCGFRWTRVNLRLAGATLMAVAIVFVLCSLLPPVWSAAAGAVAVSVAGWHAARSIADLTSHTAIPARLERVVARLRRARDAGADTER